MKLLANIIATVLHPATLTIPAVFLIVYKGSGNFSDASLWTLVSLVFTAIIAGFVLLGVQLKFFTDIDVSVKKQRVILYPFVIGVTLLFAIFIYIFKGPSVLILASLFFVAALLILDLINIKVKASVHVASVSAIVVGIIALYGGITYFLLTLIPLVAWARVHNNRHTPKETIVGAICGVGLTVMAIIVIQLIR